MVYNLAALKPVAPTRFCARVNSAEKSASNLNDPSVLVDP
jgi:hypothetical protein